METTLYITTSQKKILKTLMYFDVFNYPLTSEEIFANAPIQHGDHLNEELMELAEMGLIQKSGEFYALSDQIHSHIERRLKGNQMARDMLVTAQKISKKITRFPFVAGVCISGGLSKSYFDEKSDLDFFIITRPNRLWICRTLYILLYKTFPKKKKRLYCLNYFISESDLMINDKNLFVATELAYLIPTVNYTLYRKLLNNNSWYKEHFVNKVPFPENKSLKLRDAWYKKIIEYLFSGSFGDWVDSVFLNVTLRHWRKKYAELSDEDFDLQFRSRKHVCKRHTHGYQNKVLKLWAEKMQSYEKQFQITLH